MVLCFKIEGMSNQEVIQRVDNGYRMPRPSKPNFECPDQVYKKMRNCWDENPDKRPRFSELYQFFEAYDPAKDVMGDAADGDDSLSLPMDTSPMDTSNINSYDPYPSSGSKLSSHVSGSS